MRLAGRRPAGKARRRPDPWASWPTSEEWHRARDCSSPQPEPSRGAALVAILVSGTVVAFLVGSVVMELAR